MSKVESVVPKYQQMSGLNHGQINYASRQSFSGAAPGADDAVKKITQAIVGEITEKTGVLGKIYKFLADKDGEIQSQAINALFTTTLAPIMIAWNPFSKQDEKTKKYTALRQPVSAAIAMTGGLGMTIATNYYMNKMACEGYIANVDARIEPTKDYLKGKFKQDYKAASDKKEFLEKCNPESIKGDKFSPNGKPTKKYLDACFEGYSDKVKKERKNLFTALIGEHPDNIEIKGDSEIWVKGEKLAQKIPNLETDTQLKAYIKEHNLHVNNKLFEKIKTEMKNLKPNAEIKEVAKKFMSNKIKRMGKDFSNFNKYAGILFNLFMVGITCTALNWAYPRFVEKFFPHLAKDDNPKKDTIQKGGK